MRVIEFKLKTNSHQEIAIQEAIRVGQFIRNKCLRFWMDSTKEDKVNYSNPKSFSKNNCIDEF